jgi:subtilase family serine protease/sugar lactone lactonase YvrE
MSLRFSGSIAFGVLCLVSASAKGQVTGPRAQITQPIDEARRVVLAGNTRPEANPRNDLGPVEDSLHLDMFLQLNRSPEQEVAAREFVESLTSKNSPNFHKWITAAQYGERFGASSDDIATVKRWLESHGFRVNGVPAHRMVIDFSGSAAQVREALHTDIHYLSVRGKRAFANTRDPQIPQALAPVVTGVVSLSNIQPQPMYRSKAQYTISPRTEAVVPGDLATIYNLNPLFAAGYTGQGQTIVVVEDSDLYSGSQDWNSFRKAFGLTQYTAATLTQSHPAGVTTCGDPGVSGAAGEAALDVEWASAAAPNAAIVMASCQDTTNFGGFIALQNILTSGAAPPSVVSISYGEAETTDGPAFNAYISNLYQLAAAEGVSVFVSSGDAAAAAVDRFNSAAIFGINVSGWTSTPYNVSVGGTDFADYAAGTTGSFWSPVNGTYFNSARSYVPEIPWNDSCGSVIAANFYGFTTSYGLSGFCNSYPDYEDTAAGSGGPSGCATGAKTNGYSVSGTCTGWPKPSWQAVNGNPRDNVRDTPDVSLFAASGVWGRYLVFCFSEEASCTGSPSNWSGGGGTSFSSPAMAGIQAVINQALGTGNVGNPNPAYYAIAQNQYGTAAGMAACNSTAGPASTCAFNDVTQGDIVVPCGGTLNCFGGGQTEGVLSTSSTSFQPAYPATPGWDFATGIGSVNASNLLNAFVSAVGTTGVPVAPPLLLPANHSTTTAVTPTLTWNASGGATSYDIYLGTSNPPPMVGNTTTLSYTAAAVSPATMYYWAVGARNSMGTTVSTPFSFTTNCVPALTITSATAPAGGSAGTIPVAAPAGCAWSAASNVSFLNISSGSSGTGSGNVNYTVAPSTAASRSGTLTIAGQIFTVTQTGGALLISTLAGGSVPNTPSMGTSIALPIGYSIAADASGNVYFPSPVLNMVFKKDRNGVVTRFAGSGALGESGVGGSASQVKLDFPDGVTADSNGNVYIADSSNCRVLKVAASGVVGIVAGNASCGYSGDTAPAILASLNFPIGLAVDPSGNLYIADANNCAIRKVDTNGIITTVAGTGVCGYAGDGGPATSARIYYPYGLALDAKGNLYIADPDNYRIRMLAPDGTLSTVAGNGKCCYSGDGGPATSAEIYFPTGVAVDSTGNLYIADSDNARIRMVNPSGMISTIAGTGVSGFAGDGGVATSARLATPEGVAVDPSGNIYIADTGNSRIRTVNTGGTISTSVGGSINDGGLAVQSLLSKPSGVVRDAAGNTYVSDAGNQLVRKVTSTGLITTVAGTGSGGFSGDGGPATAAQLNAPQQLALDGAGNLYIADSGNARIRRIDSAGQIMTVAGTGSTGSTGDGGPAGSAQIGIPYGLAVDASGNLYFSDVIHHVVRKVDPTGNISTVAGTGVLGYSGDNGPAASAKLYYPASLAIDGAGNLYIADTDNFRVRMVATSGTITTVAGSGNPGFSGDGAKAVNAQLYYPYGVAVDGAGNVYIADYDNERIRQVNPSGIINTVAGNGSYSYAGDGALALGASFRHPYAVSADGQGNVAVVDQTNNAVRLLTPESGLSVLMIQSSHVGTFVAGQMSATYSVTVSNGPGAGTTNSPVTVTETLPAGLGLVQMSGSGWNCAAGQNTCTRPDALVGGASYPPITVTVNVAATAAGQLINQPSVYGGGGYPAAAQDFTLVAGAQGAASLEPVKRP